VSDVEDRRRARASWQARKFGPGAAEEAADYDALFWAQIPPEQRAAAVWELSLEMYSLTSPEAREARLPRSAFRLQRR
jgi:hypothetical protein